VSRQKVCIAKQFSHSCDLVGHYLSPCSGRGSRVVIWSQAGGLLLGVVSVPCHEDVKNLSSWNPRWLQSDCKENGLEQRQIQNGGQVPCFSPAISQFMGPRKSQCFSAKAVWVPLMFEHTSILRKLWFLASDKLAGILIFYVNRRPKIDVRYMY
jgi:hypothetical protein